MRHGSVIIDLVGLVAHGGHIAAVFTLLLHVACLHVIGARPILTFRAGLSHFVCLLTIITTSIYRITNLEITIINKIEELSLFKS